MTKLSRSQEASMVVSAALLGLAACGPLVVEPAADGAPPVDKTPTALFEDTPGTEVATAQSGEIPLRSSVITGSLVIEPAQAYADAGPDPEETNTPEPYVPDNYSVYAQGRGLDVPSNLSPEVDTQFRAFYNYIFNQQFEITNADGTVTTGSLLSASNPEINIFIAPDGTPYVKGTALDNDPAFGGGDHHFVIIWDESVGSIASLRISKLIGAPVINGFGNYTAVSPEGATYSYNPITNTWELNTPAAPTLAPTALPTETPVPTSTVVPTSTFTVTPPPASTIAAPSATPPASQNEGGVAIEIDFGVPGVESPVPVRLLQTYEDTTAASRLDPNAVRVVAAEARNGFTAVMVYPAFIEELDIYEADVPIDGEVYVTQFADLDIVYLNGSGILTQSTVRMWDGLSMGATRNHLVRELPALLGQPVIVSTAGDFLAASSSTEALLIGEPRAEASSADILLRYQTGGSGLGWTYNIRPYNP